MLSLPTWSRHSPDWTSRFAKCRPCCTRRAPPGSRSPPMFAGSRGLRRRRDVLQAIETEELERVSIRRQHYEDLHGPWWCGSTFLDGRKLVCPLQTVTCRLGSLSDECRHASDCEGPRAERSRLPPISKCTGCLIGSVRLTEAATWQGFAELQLR
jgi:hypothetical protein